MMGMMKSLYARIQNRNLCGTCRMFTGDSLSGYIRGSCPVDEDNHVEKEPCIHYNPKKRNYHEN